MRRTAFAIAALLVLAPALARADDLTLTIKDHVFSLAEIKHPSPAGFLAQSSARLGGRGRSRAPRRQQGRRGLTALNP